MKEEIKGSVHQEQIHDLLFNREIGWREIIQDLINTEQLDPWDINIVVLTDRYLAKIQELEEMDFFISSKVLLAAALLLRIKSEILLKKYIKSIDEILFGEKTGSKHIGLESGQTLDVEYNETEEIPGLISKSPMPRFRKVSLQELMASLDKAIATENRRIKKEIVKRNAFIESSLSLPKRKFSIQDKVKEIYDLLMGHLGGSDSRKKISFNEFVGDNKDERVISFSGLLHLDHQKKVWLDQEKHFEDFNIWLKEIYFANNPDPFADLKKEAVETAESEFVKSEPLDMEEKKPKGRASKDFENPIGA